MQEIEHMVTNSKNTVKEWREINNLIIKVEEGNIIKGNKGNKYQIILKEREVEDYQNMKWTVKH